MCSLHDGVSFSRGPGVCEGCQDKLDSEYSCVICMTCAKMMGPKWGISWIPNPDLSPGENSTRKQNTHPVLYSRGSCDTCKGLTDETKNTTGLFGPRGRVGNA